MLLGEQGHIMDDGGPAGQGAAMVDINRLGRVVGCRQGIVEEQADILKEALEGGYSRL